MHHPLMLWNYVELEVSRKLGRQLNTNLPKKFKNKIGNQTKYIGR